MDKENKSNRPLLSLKEIALFSMLGVIMFCSKKIMEVLPNIHLLGMFIMTFTIVFRKKALIPIYLYVGLDFLFTAYKMSLLPYFYIWTILWGMTMLLPQKTPKKAKAVIYPIICCLHGLSFGILYSPAQALMFGFNFKQTVTWIIAGLPFDFIHGISNLVCGMLIVPLSELLVKLTKKQRIE